MPRVLGDVVDYSLGTCPPGYYKWSPNGNCQPLPADVGPNEDDFSFMATPEGYSTNRIADFSGGSCGGGMVRSSPTAPCAPIRQGMLSGYDWTSNAIVPAITLFIGVFLVIKLLK